MKKQTNIRAERKHSGVVVVEIEAFVFLFLLHLDIIFIANDVSVNSIEQPVLFTFSMNSKSSLNQEEIHRYFNHLSGAKRIEFLYGLLHLCQPLELRYLGTCLEEIARKDYEYLYHTEQKTNHLSTQTVPSSSNSSVTTEHSNPSTDLSSIDEKLDLTDQFTRAHAIVDIGK